MRDAIEVCPFCREPLSMNSDDPVLGCSVRAALRTWGRSIWGAPRSFVDLVESVQVRDQTIQRVAMEVRRRELREISQPCSDRAASAPALDLASVDPFLLSQAELRKQTEHVRGCPVCAASGGIACDACSGTGKTPCAACGGTAKVTKQYKKSSKQVHCKACKKRGLLPCEACAGAGKRPCNDCSGGGFHAVWLVYEESKRWVVDIVSAEPILPDEPQLSAERFLSMRDLASFAVVSQEEATAPVAELRDQDGQDLLERVHGALEPRIDKVLRQQYLRLKLVRRDVKYAMCGRSGVVTLVGTALVGSRTLAALGPIRTRNRVWVLLSASFAVLSVVTLASFRSDGAYFSRSNGLLTALWLVANALAPFAIGGMLRAIGPGVRVRRIRPFDAVVSCAAGLSLLVMPVVHATSRPSLTEVQRALIAGELGRARMALNALSQRDRPHQVREIDDEISLAEAQALPLPERIALLDTVAARGGPKAQAAATIARSERLRAIESAIAKGAPADAIGIANGWFGDSWRHDAELAALFAAAYDRAIALCDDSACRALAAHTANVLHATPERSRRAVLERSLLLRSLTLRPTRTDSKNIEILRTIAMKTRALEGLDDELRKQAARAEEWTRNPVDARSR